MYFILEGEVGILVKT